MTAVRGGGRHGRVRTDGGVVGICVSQRRFR